MPQRVLAMALPAADDWQPSLQDPIMADSCSFHIEPPEISPPAEDVLGQCRKAL